MGSTGNKGCISWLGASRICLLASSSFPCSSLDVQGKQESAKEAIHSSVSGVPALAPPVTGTKGSRRQAAHSSNATPSVSSQTRHPLAQARALLMLSKLTAASNCADASTVMLAGCDNTLLQRRMSHTLASTSQSTETSKAGTRSSSRVSKPGRAGRAAGRARGGKGKTASAPEEECGSQSHSHPAEDMDRPTLSLQQAEPLLQAYHLSHGHPLVHRWVPSSKLLCSEQLLLETVSILTPSRYMPNNALCLTSCYRATFRNSLQPCNQSDCTKAFPVS